MVATAAVLDVLKASGLPLKAQAFDAAVCEGETPQIEGPGYSPWNVLYSGAGNLIGMTGLVNVGDASSILMVGDYRYWKGLFNTFPTWQGGKLAGGDFSTAAGGLQITRTTFEENTGFGISDFEPIAQAIFGWKLAQYRFGLQAPKCLLQTLEAGELEQINTYLVATWPGGCDTEFPARYEENLKALSTISGRHHHKRRRRWKVGG